MYPVVHLIHVCRNEKGPLDFVSERIKLNLPGFSFKKKAKTTLYRPLNSELDSISKYQLLTFYLKNFEKYEIFYILP